MSYGPIEPMLRSALDSAKKGNVIDLCSGGGGPWLELSQRLNRENQDMQILLSDKYPNLGASRKAGALHGKLITYDSDPVDAMKVPCGLAGFAQSSLPIIISRLKRLGRCCKTRLMPARASQYLKSLGVLHRRSF